MSDETKLPPAIWRLNLQRHPILRAIYNATRAVDGLPLASEQATDAVTLCAALAEQAATILDERDAAQSALAAERERREAAENLLLCYESQDFGAIAKHFARYKKEPT